MELGESACATCTSTSTIASSSAGPRKRAEKSKGRSEPRCDPSAKASKVNTTWEEQCKLGERLRDMGVSCKACLQGLSCHKSRDSGDPYKVATKQLTSAGRPCDLRKKMDEAEAEGLLTRRAGGKLSKAPTRAKAKADLCLTMSGLKRGRAWLSYATRPTG